MLTPESIPQKQHSRQQRCSTESVILSETISLDEMPKKGEASFSQLMKKTSIPIYDWDKGETKQFKVDESVFNSFLKNFKDKTRGIELAIDYSHASWGKAAGWVKELAIEKGKLMAKIEWTPAAQEAIAAGEWKYLSAEFSLDYKEGEGKKEKSYGPTLFGGGLTNRPRLKRMKEVKLSEILLDETVDTARKPAHPIENKGIKMNEELKKLQESNEKLQARLNEVDGQLAEQKKAHEEQLAKSSCLGEIRVLFSEGKIDAATLKEAQEAKTLPELQ